MHPNSRGSSPEASTQVSRFCWQVLQLDGTPDFPVAQLLREEGVQEAIYTQAFDDAVTLPPPRRYQLRVLKELISRIEAAIVDWDEHGIADSLMLTLSRLLAQPLPSEAEAAQQRCYVTYRLSLLHAEPTDAADSSPHVASHSITLLESRSLIAASGTTGLRTWEAALHLGQYLCANPPLVKSKRILELGTGTGYLAVLCAKYLGADHVIASDGSDEVVNNLPDSLFLNGLQASDKVSATELRWGHALVGTEEDAWNGGRTVDTVLGADITYDVSVIPALVATLQDLARLFPGISILIAATERNRATFESFVQVCGTRGFSVAHELFPVPPRSEQNGPFYNDQSPIHICELRKQDALET